MKTTIPPRPTFPVVTSAEVQVPIQRLRSVVEKLSVEAPDGSRRIPVPDLKLAAANARDSYVQNGLMAIRRSYLGTDEEGDIFDYQQVMDNIVAAEQKAVDLVTRGGTDMLSPKDGKDACALRNDDSLSGKLAADALASHLDPFKTAKGDRAVAIAGAKRRRQEIINGRQSVDSALTRVLTNHVKSAKGLEALKSHFRVGLIGRNFGTWSHLSFEFRVQDHMKEVAGSLVEADRRSRFPSDTLSRILTVSSYDRWAARTARNSGFLKKPHLNNRDVAKLVGTSDFDSYRTKAMQDIRAKLGMSYEDYLAGKDLPEIED